MMDKKNKNNIKLDSYNKRLFEGKNIRSKLHLSRFNWVINIIKKFSLSYNKIIELGCYDGKLLDFLPNEPSKYLGLDANWENGLDLALSKYRGKSKFNFKLINNPNQIEINADDKYDLGICMETLEHIDPCMVCDYLSKLSNCINGYLIITVPNEKGIFFLLKSLIKPKTGKKENYNFSTMDYINITLGKTNKVERDQHKGFDYEHLIYDVRKYFDIVHISGFPITNFLPKFLCFGIGILAKSKNK